MKVESGLVAGGGVLAVAVAVVAVVEVTLCPHPPRPQLEMFLAAAGSMAKVSQCHAPH